MNHVQLHKQMSAVLNELVEGKVNPKQAREYFNGAGKLISNCKNELIAVSMGAKIEIPLLEITKDDAGKLIPLPDAHKMIQR